MYYLQTHFTFFLTIVGLLGLAIGSFLNVVIYRLPIMMKREWEDECAEYLGSKPKKRTKFNLSTPNSHCPNCKHPVRIWHNIPLISYLFLLGRCPHCKNPIPLRYPIVELISAVAAVIVANHFGVTQQTLALLILTWSLIVLSFIDFKHMILPDNITVSLLWLGLIANIFGTFTTLQSAVIGAITGYLFLWIIAWLFRMIRGIEGMGYGDFKLLAVFGAWLGWQMLPLVICAASVMGLIVGIIYLLAKKSSLKKPIPFGPYIAIAGWIAMLWGPTIFNWYLALTGI